MTNFIYGGMNSKAIATENFYGIDTNSISAFVNKYVRIAVRDENKPYCSTAVATFVGGADHYRITIRGAYNDLQNGGELKTDYSFVNIIIEQKYYNGRYSAIIAGKTNANAISTENYYNLIMDKIFDMLIENMSVMADFDETAKSVLETFEADMSDEIADKMSDCVFGYQKKVDECLADLDMVAENFDGLETKLDAFTAKKILEKIKDLSDECLTACGEISGCDMVWDDGYHIDLSDIRRWWVGWSDEYFDFEDLTDLIDALDYMLGMDYDMPLADEDIMAELEEDGELTWLRGYMPIYLYDEIRDFASTYYHYAYCA